MNALPLSGLLPCDGEWQQTWSLEHLGQTCGLKSSKDTAKYIENTLMKADGCTRTAVITQIVFLMQSEVSPITQVQSLVEIYLTSSPVGDAFADRTLTLAN